MSILVGWLISALCLLVLPYIVPGVEIDSFLTALVGALVIGLLNALIRPILILLTLPITILTLGLFVFVINGLVFWVVARFLEGFHIDSFGWAIVAAIVYSLISWALNSLLFRQRFGA
jgi:putative membrane protein